MRAEYPSFTYNNESFLIIPGSRFTKNELKTRLRLMGVDDNNSQDKTLLADLYESSLKNNENKLKILSQLKKDTDNINAKLAMSQRLSLPHNYNNSSQNKKMNISYDVKPFNTRSQFINIIKPIHTNKGQYSQNPFISSNISYNQSVISLNSEKSNNYDKNTNYNNSFASDNNNNYNRNDLSYINKKDNSFLSLSNNVNNNSEEIFKNHMKNQVKKQMKEEMKELINNNKNNNINNNNENSGESWPYPNNYENTNNNYDNLNQRLNESIKNTTINQRNNNMVNFDNNPINNESKIYTNLPNSIQYPKTNEDLNYNTYTMDNSINVNTNNINDNDNDNNISNCNEKKDNIIILKDNNSETSREPDEVSTFSIFNNFSSIKKYSFYKYRKFICVHLTILLLIICFTIGILNFISYTWDNITEFFNDFLDLLSDPTHLMENIFNFFYALFFGAFHYFYITIPLIIFAVVLYLHFKKRNKKKRVRKV